jgi:hypothetical protein
MTEYFVNKKSVESSLSNTPSVMNLMDVKGETVVSYRIWNETRAEVRDNSCPTRAAIDIAATLRGCVMPIIPGFSGKTNVKKKCAGSLMKSYHFPGIRNPLQRGIEELV